MMDIKQTIEKIKSNIFLIPEARFDELTKDVSYKESFIYLVACLALSLPIIFFENLMSYKSAYFLGLSNPFFGSLFFSIFSNLFSIPIFYIFLGIQHTLLKLLGGKANFLKSTQVFIYGGTSGLVLGSLPLIGLIFSLVSLSNIVFGAKRVHNISLLKAILALIIIPVLIVTIILIFILQFIPMGYTR